MPEKTKAYWKTKAVTMAAFYNNYTEEVKEKPEEYRVTLPVFTKVWKRFIEIIVNGILEGRDFIMPYRLGTISIVKKKVRWNILKMKMDWDHFYKTGEKKYHTNDHTNNFYYKWDYNKRNAIYKNKKHYLFYPTKANKQKLHKAVIAGKDFFEK